MGLLHGVYVDGVSIGFMSGIDRVMYGVHIG